MVRTKNSCFWATADAGGTGANRAKVIRLGLSLPDQPIYKEGWSIAVQSPKPAEKKPTPAKKEKKPQGKK